MTAPARATPIEIRNESMLARAMTDVREAWAVAPWGIRSVTIGAVIVALSSTVSADVPAASGLAIALMTPAALVDWHQRRLPDAIVLTAATIFALACLAANASGTTLSQAGIALGLAVFAGPLLILHLAAPNSMGFGDVKAAAVLGMAIGAVDWGLTAWALTAAAASTAVVGIVRRRSTLPLGPGLVAGALSAVLAPALFGLDGFGF